MWWIIGIIAWLVCGVIGAGLEIAFFIGEYHNATWAEATKGSYIRILFGLANLFGIIFVLTTAGNFRHGFRLW
jgi:hypothetical protein